MFFFKNGVFFFANSFSHSYPVYPLRSAKNVEMAPSVKPKIKGLLKFKQGLSSLLSICSLDYLRKISKTKSRETQIFIQDSPMAPLFLVESFGGSYYPGQFCQNINTTGQYRYLYFAADEGREIMMQVFFGEETHDVVNISDR